jgi:hypothetical protein
VKKGRNEREEVINSKERKMKRDAKRNVQRNKK